MNEGAISAVSGRSAASENQESVVFQFALKLRCWGEGFRGRRSAQGSCPRGRKGHLPKVCLRRKKFERHDGLSVAPWPDRHHSAFRFLFAVVVHQDECLPHRHRDVQNRQSSMPAHGKGAGADLEFLVLFINSLYCQIGENGYPRGAAAFAAPKMKGGHARWSPLLSTNLEGLTARPVTSREPKLASGPRLWLSLPGASSLESSLWHFLGGIACRYQTRVCCGSTF